MAQKSDDDRPEEAETEQGSRPAAEQVPVTLAVDPVEFAALLSRLDHLEGRVRSLELRLRHIV